MISILLTVALVVGVFSFASAQEIYTTNESDSQALATDVFSNPEIIPDGNDIETEVPGENALQDDEKPEAGVPESEAGGSKEEAEPSASAEVPGQPAKPAQEPPAESNGMVMPAQEELPAEEELLAAPLAAGDEATLRSDIANAAPGGVVEISGNIELTGTPLTVDKNLTFRSTGGTVQLTVGGNIRHIDAAAGVALTFEGVELVGNAPADGGGINALGAVTLNGAVLKNCQAAQGGGVYAAGGITLNGSTLTGNKATAGNGGGAYGNGAVYVAGGAISSNTATGNGGGIYSAGTFTLVSGTINANNADKGGGTYTPAPNAFLRGGTVSNNTATDGAGFYGATVHILGGTITGNQAVETGGGLFAVSATLEDGEISGNTAGDNGGGIHTEQDFEINGGTIHGNTAATGGGADVSGEAQLNAGVISANKATTGGGLYVNGATDYVGTEINGNTAADNGGGIYAYGGIVVSGGALTGNTATSGHGGGIYAASNFSLQDGTVSGNTAGANGGGIYTAAPNAFLRGGTISDNTARQDGGGFYGPIAYVMGSTISGNTALVDGGGLFVVRITVESGLVSGNTADGNGGGIYADDWIEINNGTISGNTAANGGGISTFGDIDFNRGFITGNTALVDGGGIYGTLANITVNSGAVFAGNSASRAYLIKEEDKALYATKVFTTQLTQPFTYAYNNFDINYVGIAIEYVVTFDTQGGSAIGPALVTAGDAVARPSDPVREGYTFTGWFMDAAATQPWDFTTAVNGNMTLYAGWLENPAPVVTYTVTFDSRGGSAVAPITNIPAGSTINAPADPTREGYTFDGWFTDEAATQKWDFASGVVNGNMTLYARWNAVAGSSATSATDTPKTGDAADLWTYVWIAIAGTAILAGLLVRMKYQQKRK
ncbi:InlB B-repeat-containing protein [Christensenella timonensis]|uniref:InlB B-repeat-containing protein n=1 Tax=Christensenella timonensis TaxID=1816678 RepID=UPI0008371905|nr:InlB B-repeat-containing protein [Christensenella timonensis]